MKSLMFVTTLMISLLTANVSLAVDGKPRKTSLISKWITENAIYPTVAAENAETGTVYVSFELVNGKIENAKVVEGVSEDLDKAALEMVQNVPASELSELQPVENNTYILPIKFSIK